MPFILRYFWLICFLFTWVNLALWRRKAHVLAESGAVAAEDIDRLFKIATLWLVILCSSLAAVQLVAGWASPLCLYTLPWTAPAALASWLISFLALGSLVGWVWWGEGAALLARISPAAGGRQYSPWQVRMTLTVAALLLVVGTVAMRPSWAAEGVCF